MVVLKCYDQKKKETFIYNINITNMQTNEIGDLVNDLIYSDQKNGRSRYYRVEMV